MPARRRGRLFWLWGDTSLAKYPLGIFDATAATTPLRPLERLEPPIRLRLKYCRDAAGAPKPIARMDGPGPTWLTGVATVPDAAGRARLVGNPFPTIRCPATFEDWADPTTWEPLDAPKALRDGHEDRVVPHSGSIAWNPWRQRWVAIFLEKFGKPSAFGEIWYAEARSPSGPWGTTVKIVSHDNYTFSNPRIHPEFTGADSPALIFEATFSRQFADCPMPVARHDYNQLLYRLDLDDPALEAAR